MKASSFHSTREVNLKTVWAKKNWLWSWKVWNRESSGPFPPLSFNPVRRAPVARVHRGKHHFSLSLSTLPGSFFIAFTSVWPHRQDKEPSSSVREEKNVMSIDESLFPTWNSKYKDRLIVSSNYFLCLIAEIELVPNKISSLSGRNCQIYLFSALEVEKVGLNSLV